MELCRMIEKHVCAICYISWSKIAIELFFSVVVGRTLQKLPLGRDHMEKEHRTFTHARRITNENEQYRWNAILIDFAGIYYCNYNFRLMHLIWWCVCECYRGVSTHNTHTHSFITPRHAASSACLFQCTFQIMAKQSMQLRPWARWHFSTFKKCRIFHSLQASEAARARDGTFFH